MGVILGLGVLLIRRYVPESPRWLATHGRNDEAEEVIGGIEEKVRRWTGREGLPAVDEDETITIEQRKSIGVGIIVRAMFQMYSRRTVLGLILMGTQAFPYNAVLFTYALVLSSFYGVSEANAPYLLGAPTLTIPWTVMFFFASAAASLASLTVSEVFPIRAMAIALFYAIATALGGIAGPIIFGQLIGTGNRSSLLIGFGIAAVLMIEAAIAGLILGVRAEQRSLEGIAAPLTAIQRETGATA